MLIVILAIILLAAGIPIYVLISVKRMDRLRSEKDAQITPVPSSNTSEKLQEASGIPEASIAEPELPGTDPFRDYMDGITAEDGSKWLNASLAGVAHRNEDGSSRQRYIRELTFLDELHLVREPDNAHSTIAVAVFDVEGHQLGYIPEWLARDVAAALDSGGTASCYVQHLRQTGPTNFAVAVGVAWKTARSPRATFRDALDSDENVEEWFWAKVSRVRVEDRQAAIRTLTPGTILQLEQEAEQMWLCYARIRIAALSKQQAEIVSAGLADDRRYTALVFEIRERAGSQDFEPVIAVALMKE